MAVLVGGGSAVLMDAFHADTAAHHLEHSGITHVVGGDEMLGAAFGAVGEGVDLSRLRRGGIANFAGRAKDVVEQAQRRWNASISGVYGSSELFALTAIWPEDADASLRGLQGGVLVDDGIEVRIADIESGAAVPDGEPGELQFRGYNVINGYVNNPSASKAAFTSDGWFRTGDLGYLAHGGFVYQCRAREAMRLRGFLVEPAEIEEFLALDPSVDEVHVVGVETDSGTKAIAFVRPRAGCQVDERALLSTARQHLAGFKIPERIVGVSEFPTTTGTNGTKVRFEELRVIGRSLLAIPESPTTTSR
jgi:fatty-acyl-CoA synthase